MKLYPSCAATHPAVDTILDLRRREGFTADDVDSVDVEVASLTTRLLTYARPATGLEGKFSMPFCAAAAITYGRVGIDTFDIEIIQKPSFHSARCGFSPSRPPTAPGPRSRESRPWVILRS